MEWNNYPTLEERFNQVLDEIENLELIKKDYNEMITAFPHTISRFAHEIKLIDKKLSPLITYRDKEIAKRHSNAI